jgi:hypothetical protein
MEKPTTGVLITIWIAIMAFYYPLVLDALQHPDNAHVLAAIITFVGGFVSIVLIAYLWEKQNLWEEYIHNRRSKQSKAE